MVPKEDLRIIEAMMAYGGSFVKSLAQCLYQADSVNYGKIKKALPDYFKEYKKMAETGRIE